MQLFRKHEFHLDHIQTLDDHAAAVGDVKFLDRTTLLSISSDRTIIVRKLARRGEQSIAFLSVRVITLKASPVSLVPVDPDVVLVSTLDRQVLSYNVSSGRLLHSFKASDPNSGDGVIVSSLEVHELEHLTPVSRLILGVSSTDKSIRIHEYDSGAMLIREYGQNAVSAIKLFRSHIKGESPRDHLVSCGHDGTVMTWNLSCNLKKSTGSHDTPNGEESPSIQISPSAEPLRRILSKAEVSDLQKSLVSDGDRVTPMRSSSPSRVRRKNSRHSLTAAPKVFAPKPSHPIGASLSPANVRVQYQLSQSHSPTPSSQKNTLKSKPKPPSLDSRQRSKSGANLNDLNDLGKQICVSLRSFRSRIASSSVAKLEHGTLQELVQELSLAIIALDDGAGSKCVSDEALGGDVMDFNLARMIDRRLAMKAKPQETTFVDGQQNEVIGPQELV